MASRHLMVGNGEVRMIKGTGDGQEVNTQKLFDKKANKQVLEKRGKSKKDARQREASCWCVQLLDCFACGAVKQEEDEQLEKVQAKTEQKPAESWSWSQQCSNTPKESKKKNKIEKHRGEQKGQSVGITLSAVPIMSKEERLKGREESRKAYKAYLQKFLKLRKDDRMRKKAYDCIQRKRRAVEANIEWSALPIQSEDAERKVVFNEAHLCDVWYYEEEKMPSQRCLKWMRTLDEIRYKKAMEERENVVREAVQEERMEGREELLRGAEKDQLVLLGQGPPVSHSDAPKVLLFLVIGTALCVVLWFCSLRHRGFRQIHFLQ